MKWKIRLDYLVIGLDPLRSRCNLDVEQALYSFIHLFSVNLLQDMEIVISIIIQGRKQQHRIYIEFVKKL